MKKSHVLQEKLSTIEEKHKLLQKAYQALEQSYKQLEIKYMQCENVKEEMKSRWLDVLNENNTLNANQKFLIEIL